MINRYQQKKTADMSFRFSDFNVKSGDISSYNSSLQNSDKFPDAAAILAKKATKDTSLKVTPEALSNSGSKKYSINSIEQLFKKPSANFEKQKNLSFHAEENKKKKTKLTIEALVNMKCNLSCKVSIEDLQLRLTKS